MNLLLFLDRLLFALVHLTAAVLLVLVGWWSRWTPEQATAAFASLLQSDALSAAQLAGLSGAALVSGYLAVARWVWRKTAWPVLLRRVLKGV